MLSINLRRSPFTNICKSCYRRLYSTPTTPAPAPLLLKFREDLKTAMRAKDTNRLNVLRALLSEINNAAKTSTPYDTDAQILRLLMRKMKSSQETAATFKEQKREDLVSTENAQASVMQEYANMVEVMDEESIDKSINEVFDRLQAEKGNVSQGEVLKALFGPGGPFMDMAVNRGDIAKKVMKILKPEGNSKQ